MRVETVPAAYADVIMRPAFSLIELLVAITVIMLLMGMLAAGGIVVLQRAHRASTQALVANVVQALHLYRDEDSRRRFPPDRPDQTMRHDIAGPYAGGIPRVVTMLMATGLAIHGEMLGQDTNGDYLADAWGEPLHYQVDALIDGTPHRPLDSAGQPVRVPEEVTDWNPAGTQPYAYLWSCGRPKADSGTRAKATNWVYFREGL